MILRTKFTANPAKPIRINNFVLPEAAKINVMFCKMQDINDDINAKTGSPLKYFSEYRVFIASGAAESTLNANNAVEI